jgi:hypothetical protein
MAADKITDRPETAPQPDLTLLVRPELVPAFNELLQSGVVVGAPIGSTIQTFLCETLGLKPQYVEERIQTIFLNGKAVDDPASAVINDHATIALSAAMPGLLGATLRKGGFYAKMRGEISHAGQEKVSPHEGRVVLKLFNLLPAEIGSLILEKGVWVDGKILKAFFEKRLSLFLEGCRETRLHGRSVDVGRLAEQQWPDGHVFLKVQKG